MWDSGSAGKDGLRAFRAWDFQSFRGSVLRSLMIFWGIEVRSQVLNGKPRSTLNPNR